MGEDFLEVVAEEEAEAGNLCTKISTECGIIIVLNLLYEDHSMDSWHTHFNSYR